MRTRPIAAAVAAISLALAMTAGPAQATERFLTILNRTDFVIKQVTASRSNDPLQTNVIFDQTEVYEGEQARYSIEDTNDECFFDIGLVLGDGTKYSFNGVNICVLKVLPVTDEALQDQFQRDYQQGR